MPNDKFWFPAKTYGWGWGWPSCWQGWVVMAVYMVLLIAGTQWFQPASDALHFSVYTVALSVVLLAICWAKGEPPQWRWGKPKSDA